MDGNVVGLETDKATFDVPAPTAGTITRVLKDVGETAAVGEVIGFMTASEAPVETPATGPSTSPAASTSASVESAHVMPAAERMMDENNVTPGAVSGSGPGGRVLKEDVARHLLGDGVAQVSGTRETKSVPMSPIRQTIATRLVSAQQTAALLTTFNEIDMLAVRQLRQQYKDSFEKKIRHQTGVHVVLCASGRGRVAAVPRDQCADGRQQAYLSQLL